MRISIRWKFAKKSCEVINKKVTEKWSCLLLSQLSQESSQLSQESSQLSQERPVDGTAAETILNVKIMRT